MRILFEALGFGEGDNLGGSVRVARANAGALAARGHEVTFVCTNRKDRRSVMAPGSTERVSADGIRVVQLRTSTIPAWPGSFGPHWVHGARRWLDATLPTFDIVHIHEFRSFLALATAAAARRAAIPYVVQPQGTLRGGERTLRLKRLYDGLFGRALLDGAARVIAATTSELALFAAAGVPGGRSVVVPNGLDLAPLEPLPARGRFRARHGIPGDAPMILAVGRLELTKGQDILLRAFAALRHPSAVLVLVGPDHGIAGELRRLMVETGCERGVVITGALAEDREVLEALVDADVFCLPSRYEAFGMAILEACAASRPMVLSEGCQNADAFRDRAALVVPCAVEPMRDGLARLLGDPGTRERFGAAGRRILEQDYTLPAVAERLEAVYRAVAVPKAPARQAS